MDSFTFTYIKKEPATKQIPHLFVVRQAWAQSYYNNTLVNLLTKEDTAPSVEGVHLVINSVDSDAVINFRLKENSLQNALLGDVDMPYVKGGETISKGSSGSNSTYNNK